MFSRPREKTLDGEGSGHLQDVNRPRQPWERASALRGARALLPNTEEELEAELYRLKGRLSAS